MIISTRVIFWRDSTAISCFSLNRPFIFSPTTRDEAKEAGADWDEDRLRDQAEAGNVTAIFFIGCVFVQSALMIARCLGP